MTDDPSDAAKKDAAPTVRELEGPGISGDTLREVPGHYVAPRKLPEASRHRTIDLSPVRLSADADPRRAPTELRLPSPPQRRRAATVWLVAGLGVAVLAVTAWALSRQPADQAELPSIETHPAAGPAIPAPKLGAATPEPAATPAPDTSSVASRSPVPNAVSSASSPEPATASSAPSPVARTGERPASGAEEPARKTSKVPAGTPRPTATSRAEPAGSKQRRVWLE